MKTVNEILEDTWLVDLPAFTDARGQFVKTYADASFQRFLRGKEIKEQYYSSSAFNTIRGMHFQTPPHAHFKIVHCLGGAVKDVLLDLRRGPNYGRHFSLTLDGETPRAIVIPPGIAHGFKAIRPGSVMLYATTSEYAPEADAGVLWSSFGAEWECPDPIVSDRDSKHPMFSDFHSPF